MDWMSMAQVCLWSNGSAGDGRRRGKVDGPIGRRGKDVCEHGSCGADEADGAHRADGRDEAYGTDGAHRADGRDGTYRAHETYRDDGAHELPAALLISVGSILSAAKSSKGWQTPWKFENSWQHSLIFNTASADPLAALWKSHAC